MLLSVGRSVDPVKPPPRSKRRQTISNYNSTFQFSALMPPGLSRQSSAPASQFSMSLEEQNNTSSTSEETPKIPDLHRSSNANQNLLPILETKKTSLLDDSSSDEEMSNDELDLDNLIEHLEDHDVKSLSIKVLTRSTSR